MSNAVRITLADGSVHIFPFPAGRKPRYAKSWAMQQMPYGTDYFRCRIDLVIV